MRLIITMILPMRTRGFSLALLAAVALAGCGGKPRDRSVAVRDTTARVETAAAQPSPARPDPRDEVPRVHRGGALCARLGQPVRSATDTASMFAHEDMATHPAFRCRAGHGRVVRLVAIGEPDSWVDSVLVLAGDGSVAPIDVLRVEDGEPPPLGADFLRGEDLNHDGWMDVQLSRFWGATGNVMADVFMYDPPRARFVRDTVLSDGGENEPVAGRPCVRSHWNGGHAGAIYGMVENCWIAGRWQASWSVSQDWDREISHGDTMVYLRTTRRRQPDGRYTTRVDTLGRDGDDDLSPPDEP